MLICVIILNCCLALGTYFGNPGLLRGCGDQGDPTGIRGRVLDESGSPRARAQVTLTCVSGTEQQSALTDESGWFEFRPTQNTPASLSVVLEESTCLMKLVDLSNVTGDVEIRVNAPCSGQSATDADLSESDIAAIRTDLAKAALGTGNVNVLCSDSFDAMQLRGEVPEQVKLLTRAEIATYAKTVEHFQFAQIGPLNARGTCVVGSYDITCMSEGQPGGLCGEGATLEYRKVDGHWTGTVVCSWIS